MGTGNTDGRRRSAGFDKGDRVEGTVVFIFSRRKRTSCQRGRQLLSLAAIKGAHSGPGAIRNFSDFTSTTRLGKAVFQFAFMARSDIQIVVNEMEANHAALPWLR